MSREIPVFDAKRPFGDPVRIITSTDLNGERDNGVTEGGTEPPRPRQCGDQLAKGSGGRRRGGSSKLRTADFR